MTATHLKLQAQLGRVLNHPDVGATVTWFGRFDDYTGYGQAATAIASRLATRLPLETVWTPGSEFKYAPAPDVLRATRRTALPATAGGRCVMMYPQPDSLVSVPHNQRVSYFTMWESTRISTAWRDAMNQCERVIVPNAWNASCFDACGVKVPIAIVQLGLDLREWPQTPLPERRPFIIGAAGNFDPSGNRKGLAEVAEAFRRAFPYQQDVRLEIKTLCHEPDFGRDPRVIAHRQWWPNARLSQWYRQLHVFASASAAEGWGLHHQEAMACGRPVIGALFGGVTEFVNAENGYPVDYRLVPGRGAWAGCGRYAEVNVDDMARAMLAAYHDREQLEYRSARAAVAARRWPIELTVARLEDLCRL